jgi:protein TonB
MAARSVEPRLDSAPEAFAEDDDAPSALRLFAVGTQGQTGSALVMPSFAGDLAVIEQELAQQGADGRTSASTSLAGAAATFVRTRPVPIIAFGLGAAALALLTWGPGTTSGDDNLPIAPPARTQPAPIVAPVLDSAAGSLTAGSGTEGSANDRSSSADRNSPSTDRTNSSSSDARSASKSTPEKTTAPATSTSAPTRSVPDLPRPLPNVVNAQLDEAMRVAGRSSSGSTEAITKPSVTFSSGILTSPDASLPGATAPQNATQAALIGSMPQIAYPQALRARGREVQGQVLVEFAVDTLGRPDIYTVNVLKSDHELFTAAVRTAIPSMRFVPATQNGKKVRGVVTTQFRFAMDKQQDDQR